MSSHLLSSSPQSGGPWLALQISPARTCLIHSLGLKLYPDKHLMSTKCNRLSWEGQALEEQVPGTWSWRHSCRLHLCALHTPFLSVLASQSRLHGDVHWGGFWHLRAVATALIRSWYPLAEAGMRGWDYICDIIGEPQTGRGWQDRIGSFSSSLLGWFLGEGHRHCTSSLWGPMPGWPLGSLGWLWRMMRSQDINVKTGHLHGPIKHNEMKPLPRKTFSYTLCMYHV